MTEQFSSGAGVVNRSPPSRNRGNLITGSRRDFPTKEQPNGEDRNSSKPGAQLTPGTLNGFERCTVRMFPKKVLSASACIERMLQPSATRKSRSEVVRLCSATATLPLVCRIRLTLKSVFRVLNLFRPNAQSACNFSCRTLSDMNRAA